VWIGFALFPLLLTLLLVLPYLDQNAYVTILDVGQGDAIVIETPYRQEVVLIDVGGSVRLYREDWQEPSQPFEVGRDVILPYLKYRGINHVDKIVISHGHYDHWGGLEGLLGQIPIGMVIHPPLAPQSDPEKEWLAKIQHKQIPLYFVDRGDGWRTADAQFLVLYPEVDDQFKHYADHVHRYNLVLWNKIYNTTFLWTGDVEEEGEHDILDTYPHLETDVLKVAHHGSRTSSSERWLERIKPDVSVISAGRFNLYGHPHEEVLWRLGQSGSTLFNTAWHGAIFIVVKPSGYSIVPTLQPDWDSVQ
jgi:competence protein ComEC